MTPRRAAGAVLTVLGQLALVVLSFILLWSLTWGMPLWIPYMYVVWFLVYGVVMPIDFYWILVGRPSWRAMKARWRWLHQVHYRY